MDDGEDQHQAQQQRGVVEARHGDGGLEADRREGRDRGQRRGDQHLAAGPQVGGGRDGQHHREHAPRHGGEDRGTGAQHGGVDHEGDHAQRQRQRPRHPRATAGPHGQRPRQHGRHRDGTDPADPPGPHGERGRDQRRHPAEQHQAGEAPQQGPGPARTAGARPRRSGRRVRAARPGRRARRASVRAGSVPARRGRRRPARLARPSASPGRPRPVRGGAGALHGGRGRPGRADGDLPGAARRPSGTPSRRRLVGDATAPDGPPDGGGHGPEVTGVRIPRAAAGRLGPHWNRTGGLLRDRPRGGYGGRMDGIDKSGLELDGRDPAGPVPRRVRGRRRGGGGGPVGADGPVGDVHAEDPPRGGPWRGCSPDSTRCTGPPRWSACSRSTCRT